jgi:hypothetical protein
LGKDWSRFWGDRFWRPDRPSVSSSRGFGNQDDSDESAESAEQEGEENGDREDDRGGGFAVLDDRGDVDRLDGLAGGGQLLGHLKNLNRLHFQDD